jgi:hypothetical protein
MADNVTSSHMAIHTYVPIGEEEYVTSSNALLLLLPSLLIPLLLLLLLLLCAGSLFPEADRVRRIDIGGAAGTATTNKQ